MARIISIVNQKGGTGKSACTANLAVGLAQKNKKVLIVDADPQSDVSAGFGYRDCDDSNETLTALMDAVMKDEDIPSDCYIRHQAEGIDIICSNIGLAGTEVQLVNAMSREYVLKQILYGIKDQYDAVIIDCMPSLGMITINGVIGSNANKRAFSDDSSYCLLCSLEDLNEDGTLKRKADMFTKRTIKKAVAVTSVETATEALALSLNERAKVDLSYSVKPKSIDFTGLDYIYLPQNKSRE